MSTERKEVPATGAIEEVASEWLIRRDSPSWSADDQRGFDEWLNDSSLHRVAYLRLEAAWEDAARLKALGAGFPGDVPPPRGEWNLGPYFSASRKDSSSSLPDESAADELSVDQDRKEEPAPAGASEVRSASAPRPRRWNVARMSLAATAVLAVGVGAYVTLLSRGERHSTAVGRIETVALPDGSKVTLNTDSEIRVRLTDAERDIDLKQGEAFFEVAKDARRPFVVTAGGKRVIAVGTQFSVRRELSDVEIVVTEGQVRVEEGAARAGGSVAQEVLTPGNIAHAGTAGVLVQRESVAQAEVRLSWRSGILMFRDQSLRSAVEEFNRYNARKIVIADPDVAALKIEGNFRATNVDAFVRLLESGFPVHAATEGGQIILTSGEPVTRP